MSDLATRDDFDHLGRSIESLASSLVSNIEAQTNAMQDLAKAVTDQRHVESARASGGRAEIHFNAGGLALWLVVTIAGMMLVANLCILVGGALWLGRIDRENSEHGHQLNAIYILAPHLKPKEPKQ